MNMRIYNADVTLNKFYFKTMANNIIILLSIVTRDMVWKLGELQSVYNELHFNVEGLFI